MSIGAIGAILQLCSSMVVAISSATIIRQYDSDHQQTKMQELRRGIDRISQTLTGISEQVNDSGLQQTIRGVTGPLERLQERLVR